MYSYKSELFTKTHVQLCVDLLMYIYFRLHQRCSCSIWHGKMEHCIGRRSLKTPLRGCLSVHFIHADNCQSGQHVLFCADDYRVPQQTSNGCKNWHELTATGGLRSRSTKTRYDWRVSCQISELHSRTRWEIDTIQTRCLLAHEYCALNFKVPSERCFFYVYDEGATGIMPFSCVMCAE